MSGFAPPLIAPMTRPWQMPPTHVPPWQLLPQAPQLVAELVRSTHAFGHTDSPPVQTVHMVFRHAAPAAHCAFAVQVPKQAAVPLHANGAHVVVVTGGQLPMPSQLAALVCVPDAQLAVRHEMVGNVQFDDPPPHVPAHVPLPAQVG